MASVAAVLILTSGVVTALENDNYWAGCTLAAMALATLILSIAAQRRRARSDEQPPACPFRRN